MGQNIFKDHPCHVGQIDTNSYVLRKKNEIAKDNTTIY